MRVFSAILISLLLICQGESSEPLSLLRLSGYHTDPNEIDYASLPLLQGKHIVINGAEPSPGIQSGDKLELNRLRLQLHNYLIFHDGKFWCIWSDGPNIEDKPTQEIKYATSQDGISWSAAKPLTGQPEAPHAFIARGLWLREGELIALAAHFKGPAAFGKDKDLELRAYLWDEEGKEWKFKEVVYENAINNFPPQKLPNGDWILTRRDSRFNVTIMIGGRESISGWQTYPVVDVTEVPEFRPDEPIFWLLPDQSLNALFRDNSGSQRLFHATSTDLGKSWSTPVITNFPNSTSKIFSTDTSRGFRVMVSNANPRVGRRELHLSISRDGVHFTQVAKLDIPTPPVISGMEGLWKKFEQGISSLQYPHVIEHDGHLWIALSRNKVQTELFRASLDDVEALIE